MHSLAIITPVYNGASYIVDCIQSVIQSIRDDDVSIEHVLIDDASTDASYTVMQSMQHLPHIKLLQNISRFGAGHARNIAVSETSAEYIFCLDADDVIFQQSLYILSQALRKTTSGWVYGDFLRSDERLTYRIGDDYYGHAFTDREALLTSLFTGEHFFQQNSMYTRSLFDTVGGFDATLDGAQDFDLCVRFALHGVLPVYVPGPLYMHRFHANNMSKLSGREGNVLKHRDDVRRFFTKYERALTHTLSLPALTKIHTYLN